MLPLRHLSALGLLVGLVADCSRPATPPAASKSATAFADDSVAEAAFSTFISARRTALEEVLRVGGIEPDSGEARLELRPWVASVPRNSPDDGTRYGVLMVTGQKRLAGMRIPEILSLQFRRPTPTSTWCLLLEDGYLLPEEDESQRDATSGLPPEVHVGVKQVFPDLIDLGLRRWTTPGCASGGQPRATDGE